MKVFAIGDLHLSLSVDKPMDIFAGWTDYVEKLTDNWKKLIKDEDIVVLAGDTSWGMDLNETTTDFAFINNLPGKKYIIKGNHDYWWDTRKKLETFFFNNGFDTLNILQNNAVETDNFIICGTRGWLFENGEPHDAKILQREAGRLELSLQSIKSDKEKIVFLHYPPVYCDQCSAEILDVLLKYNVKRCYYGHIHGYGIGNALNGIYAGIEFKLISADALGFCPIEIV